MYDRDLGPNWGYGSDAWRKEMAAMDRQLVMGPQYDLGDYLGPGAKRVVINDTLPAGQMFVTGAEIILSQVGWERLIAALKRKEECRVAVRRIIDREMGDVLVWLREAGHEV